MDVVEILKIKPSPRLLEDHFAWAPEKNDFFTVKSTYGSAMDESWRLMSGSSSSNPDARRNIWNLIWKSDVPPKVQHFA
jgi:hypothetical protein